VLLEPVAHAVLIFFLVVALSAFFLAGASSDEARAATFGYLVGAPQTYGGLDIILGFSIYYLSAIPYTRVGPHLDSAFLIGAAASILTLQAVLLLYIGAARLKLVTRTDAVVGLTGDAHRAALVVTLCALGVSAALIMALQPLKLGWALDGASTRYATSLYTWISLTVLAAITLHAAAARKLVVGMVVVALLPAGLAAYKNLEFTREYAHSMESWRAINRAARKEVGGTVQLQPSVLRHPYIAPIDANYVDRYLRFVYGKRASFCTFSDGFVDLSFSDAMLPVKLAGFSVAESAGRWTVEPNAAISLGFPLEEGDVVGVTLAHTFGEKQLTITLGEAGLVRDAVPTREYTLVVTEGFDEPVLVIAADNSTSPASLGISDDARPLGVMVRGIRVPEERLQVVEQASCLRSG
jgi:hypothetical protein